MTARGDDINGDKGSRTALYSNESVAEEAINRVQAALRRPLRVVFVHAHPDDESFFTGATIAKYSSAGAIITLITCTVGDGGYLRNRAHEGAATPKEVARVRAAELDAACRLLGVHEVVFLADGRYSDRGNDPSFAGNGRRLIDSMAAATSDLEELLLRVKPDVLVTYDSDGVTGHADHIAVHKACMAACESLYTHGATVPPYRLLAIHEGADVRPADARRLGLSGRPHVARTYDASEALLEVDGSQYLSRKWSAVEAHASQMGRIEDPGFRESSTYAVLSHARRAGLDWAKERYVLLKEYRMPPRYDDGLLAPIAQQQA